MLRPTAIAAALLIAATTSVGVAQEVTPSTPATDSRYGSTTPPPDSPADTKGAVLSSRGDPNPTSMGTGHALSEALTRGAPNATPTRGAAPAATPLLGRRSHRRPTAAASAAGAAGSPPPF